MSDIKVLVIIPCYNESVSLPMVLDNLFRINIPVKYKLSTLVVNDCSTDNTESVANRHGAMVLNLPCNLGIGGAVQAGFKYAKAYDFDLAVQLDGDGQHPPAELLKLLQVQTEHDADLVIGSRFLDREGFQSSFFRRAGIRYFYQLNKLLTGNPIYDSTSGFRVLSRKAILIAAAHYPDDYPEPESLVIFSKAGLIIKETPVIMSRRLGGRSSISLSRSVYYGIKVTLAMLYSYIRKSR